MIIVNYIKIFNKIIFNIFILFFLCSCSLHNTNKTKNVPSINKYLISEYEVPEDYFISNYANNELKNYDRKKTNDLYNNLKKESSNYNSLNKNDIFNLMGIPALLKATNKQEIWQYRSKDCILNIIWNHKNNTILDFISYNGNLEKIEAQICLMSIISTNISKK